MSWLSHERRGAISLSLPLTSQVYSGQLVENYFDNLLPDSHPIRNRLQARVGAESAGVFELLRLIGRDCAPIYDVMSIYPVISTGTLSTRKVTMAMAALGKNRHYRWDSIVRRHWLSTARKCRFPEEEMEEVITRCCDLAPACVEEVGNNLPRAFPAHISDAIFTSLLRVRDRLI